MQCPDCKQLRHVGDCEPQPDGYEQYIETLRLHAKQTEDAYIAFLATVPSAYERTKDQQREVDTYLRAKMAAYYAMIHAGVNKIELPLKGNYCK